MAVVLGLPETPRWLVKNDRIEDAGAVLRRVYGSSESTEAINAQLKEIRETVELERSTDFRWATLFRRGDPLRTGWRVFLACLILLMNQVCCRPVR
jgi:hypothetical protein